VQRVEDLLDVERLEAGTAQAVRDVAEQLEVAPLPVGDGVDEDVVDPAEVLDDLVDLAAFLRGAAVVGIPIGVEADAGQLSGLDQLLRLAERLTHAGQATGAQLADLLHVGAAGVVDVAHAGTGEVGHQIAARGETDQRDQGVCVLVFLEREQLLDGGLEVLHVVVHRAGRIYHEDVVRGLSLRLDVGVVDELGFHQEVPGGVTLVVP